jgi:glycyl-tRNA synthetase
MSIKLDTIVKYAHRNGFVYPSSEIYGGYSAVYDFGPLGKLLKDNLVQAWRDWMVTYRDDVVEIEGAIFLHPKVWEASGHIGGFSDLLVEDTITHKRYRADHLIEDAGIMENADSLSPEETDKVIADNNILSPDGNPLTNAKQFNLLVQTHLGATVDESTVAYLKGEACQNIYVNWKLVQETSRRQLPFGIAQLGKAFRNEITVKQYIFRTREFEQIDLQFFVKPGEEDSWYEFWKDYRYKFYTEYLGYNPANLQFRQHEKLVFYAKDAWDIDYKFGALGFKEMEGIHNRTDYDTKQHSEFSGKDLQYRDPQTNEKYYPYVIESSLGVNRLLLSTLFEFYNEENVENSSESRIVLKFPYILAPYKIAILPLMKKDGLAEQAKDIYMNLRQKGIMADIDLAGSIGKRYRRQDEIGTPWCVTVDYETLSEGTVTIRHRDSMEQLRIDIEDISVYLNPETFAEFK